MTCYVLVHGASSDAFMWHRVVPLLVELGHDVVTAVMPVDDPDAGIDEYAAAIVDVWPTGEDDVVLVLQSLSGLTGPLVCEAVRPSLVVLLAAMTPKAGESPGEWWAATGWEQARRELLGEARTPEPDVERDFFHDLTADVLADLLAHGERGQTGTVFERVRPLPPWPDVPVRFIAPRDDRFFPIAFQRRVVRERLGVDVDEIGGGHLAALSQPEALIEALERLRAVATP